jgi:hypothetical protein
MDQIKNNEQIRKAALVLSVFGITIPNGIFLYYFFSDPALFLSAFSNPISLVFILEAFMLLFFIAWILSGLGIKQPSGPVFIVLSIIGSLGFSVPYLVYKQLQELPGAESLKTDS